VQRENVITLRVLRGQGKQMVHRIHPFEIRPTDQLIESRQCRRQLRHRHLRTVYNRHERTHSSCVRSITKPQLLLQRGDILVDLPPGRAVHSRALCKNAYKLVERERELTTRPGLAGAGHSILPFDMVIRVHANLETSTGNVLHEGPRAPAYVRAWKQNTVQKRLQTIVLENGGPFHLAHETRAKNTLDRTAGVIGADTEKKGGACSDLCQNLYQAWNTLACPSKGVDVNFEGDRGQYGTSQPRATGWRCNCSAAAGKSTGPAPSAAAMIRSTLPSQHAT
jgi:hypothetical protein